tara:strand:+ start:163 stop:480 length:318 start_codon:yes stop_codon:yes gene_type:complete
LVEQGIENPRVGGSIPPPGTIKNSDEARHCAGFVVSGSHELIHPLCYPGVAPEHSSNPRHYICRPLMVFNALNQLFVYHDSKLSGALKRRLEQRRTQTYKLNAYD